MLKKHTDSTKKFFETDIFIMLKFLIDNIFAIFGGRGSKESRYSNEYQLYSSCLRSVPLFLGGRLRIGASQEKRKESISLL